MRKTQRAKIIISDEEKQELIVKSKSKTTSYREVQRSSIILNYMEGKTITDIAKVCHTNRPLVERCIDKAIAYGVKTALKDLPGRGVEPTITDDAKSWVLSIACQSPKEMGYANEIWTYSLMIKHIRANCKANNHSCSFAQPDTPTPFPTFTPTPAPLPVYFLVAQDRVCEPGPAQIRVVVEDEKGQGTPGVEVWVTWDNGADRFVTGLKPEKGNGYGDMDMQSNTVYAVAVAESALPIARGIKTEPCPSSVPTQTIWASWQMTFRPIPPTPTPSPTPGPSPTLTAIVTPTYTPGPSPTLAATVTITRTASATRKP